MVGFCLMKKAATQPTILEQSPGHYRLQYAKPKNIPPSDLKNWLTEHLDMFLEQEKRELWDLPRIEASSEDSIYVLTRVYPPVQLPTMPLQMEIPLVQTPTEELLQNRLIELQYQLAEVQEQERPTQEGDRITLSYYAEIDGSPVPETAQNKLKAILRDDLIGPGFYKNLLGQMPGAELQIVWNQENSHKDLIYRIIIHTVESLKLPELNQDFPAKTGLGNTWQEFFSKLYQGLQSEYEQQWRVFVRQALIYTLAEQSQIEIPEDLFIAHQLQAWQSQEGKTLSEMGLSESDKEKAFQIWSETPNVYQNTYADLRASLALREFIKQNQLSISSDELAVLLGPFSENLKQPIETIYNALNETGELQSLLDQALTEKAMDLLLSKTRFSHQGVEIAQT
jgi:trigger factor